MYPFIQIGQQTLRVYDLIAGFNVLVSGLLVLLILKKLRYSWLEIISLYLLIIVLFFVGARVLNYVVNYPAYVKSNTPIWQWSFVGFSVYGGMITVLLGSILYHVFRKRSFWLFLDHMVIPFALSFVLMRIGCLLNGCCYGHYTKLPWGIPLSESKQFSIALITGKSVASQLRVHPTQFYELMGTLIGIVIVAYFLKKKKLREGMLAIGFGIYFTVLRLLILPLRELPYPDWVIGYLYPGLYIGLIILGVILFIKRGKDKG